MTFFEEKMKRVERALYGLRGVGCKPDGLHPCKVAFVYKQYCQAIFKYGLETLSITKGTLRLLNFRQNLLIKNVLGLKHILRIKPLLSILKIDQLTQLYYKHKLFFFKQILFNPLTNDLFFYLKGYYSFLKPTYFSFFSQFSELSTFLNLEISFSNYKILLSRIDELFASNDIEMLAELRKCLSEHTCERFFITINKINDILKIEF